MKTISLFLLIVVNLLIAQKSNEEKLFYELMIDANKQSLVLSNSQDESGLLYGAITLNKANSKLGIKSKIDKLFFDYFNGNDISKNMFENYNSVIDDLLILFRLTPLKTNLDSIFLSCDYLVFEKQNTSSEIINSFYINHYNNKIIATTNNASKLNFFSPYLMNSSISIKLFWQKSAKESFSSIGKKYYNDFNEKTYNPVEIFNKESFNNLLKSSSSSKKILNIGFEWLRIDESNTRIIFQKSSSPLLRYYLDKFDTENQIDKNYYSGFTSVPYTIYFTDKSFLDTLSQEARERNVIMSIAVFPFNKTDNMYTMKILLCQITNNTKWYTYKKVDIEKGEKIKIDIVPLVASSKEKFLNTNLNVNVEVIRDTNTTSLKEFILLSLDEAEYSKENNSVKRMSEIIDEIQTTSKKSEKRDALVEKLTSLVADAQSFYRKSNKRNKSFANWKLPDVYKNYKELHFELKIKPNEVEIIGTSQTVGNDNINPIKVIMICAPDRIISTNVIN